MPRQSIMKLKIISKKNTFKFILCQQSASRHGAALMVVCIPNESGNHLSASQVI